MVTFFKALYFYFFYVSHDNFPIMIITFRTQFLILQVNVSCPIFITLEIPSIEGMLTNKIRQKIANNFANKETVARHLLGTQKRNGVF